MILLCGHGKYGETIKNSVEMIAGKQDNIFSIDFIEEMSVTDIIEQYNKRDTGIYGIESINDAQSGHGGKYRE